MPCESLILMSSGQINSSSRFAVTPEDICPLVNVTMIGKSNVWLVGDDSKAVDSLFKRTLVKQTDSALDFEGPEATEILN